MAVVIRLSRHGTTKRPFYRIVAADKQYPRDGRYLEILGTYNPKTKATSVKKERVEHWISKGAIASPTVVGVIERSQVAKAS